MNKENAWEYLMRVNKAVCGLVSREKPGAKASNSELKRWLLNKAILINGKTPGPEDVIEFPITQLVLFYKSDKSRTTIV